MSEALPYESVVVNKSTVPVGSARVVERVLDRPDVQVGRTPSSFVKARRCRTSSSPTASSSAARTSRQRSRCRRCTSESPRR